MRLFTFVTAKMYLLTAALLINPVSAQALTIVTTIKPLHSIVSNITYNINQPVLLITKSISAHHYQLTPRDKLNIAKADQIFWFGPAIETAFSNNLTKKSMRMLTLENLTTHTMRETHAHVDEEHNHHHEADPHIWLDTNNAITIAYAVAVQLGKLDPEHAEQYINNADTFARKVKTLHGELEAAYRDVQQQPFASLHDAFQYIEKQFKLQYSGNISLHPLLPLSGKQRLKINQTIQEKNIQCIFYDPAHHPKAAQQLASQQKVRLQALDPIGYELKPGQSLYFNLLKNLANDITGCLSI